MRLDIFMTIKRKIFFVLIAFLIIILGINFYVKYNSNKLCFKNINNLPETEVAIVFGAGINGDVPSKYLKDRLDAGILLYKNKKVQKLLLSGDNGSDEHDEIVVMKKYCYKNGVDTTKIYVDYAGFDTYSTMIRAKKVFNVKKAILISQNYHLDRAVYLGNALGVESVGFIADNGEYNMQKLNKFRELLATVKSVIDVNRNRKPIFLGSKVDINGLSNYTK